MTRTACLNSIYELAKIDERVVFIGTDLAPNTLPDFKRDFPDRYFMCGVQEQSTMGMAAGLALEGFIPYVNNIATFLTRRCYEQIVCDVALHNLPVRLIANGGGLVYTPLGPTHMAIDDIAIIRTIPNMSVVCCADNEEMKAFMPSTLINLSPMYIRLGRDTDPILPNGVEFSPAKLVVLSHSPTHILIIATGTMVYNTMMTMKLSGIPTTLLQISTIKPFPFIDDILSDTPKLIVTVEEHLINGGLGTAVLEYLSDRRMNIPVLRFGIPDEFPCHYGEQQDLLETYGLTPQAMAQKIKEFYDSL